MAGARAEASERGRGAAGLWSELAKVSVEPEKASAGQEDSGWASVSARVAVEWALVLPAVEWALDSAGAVSELAGAVSELAGAVSASGGLPMSRAGRRH